jgi:hypothetical protein
MARRSAGRPGTEAGRGGEAEIAGARDSSARSARYASNIRREVRRPDASTSGPHIGHNVDRSRRRGRPEAIGPSLLAASVPRRSGRPPSAPHVAPPSRHHSRQPAPGNHLPPDREHRLQAAPGEDLERRMPGTSRRAVRRPLRPVHGAPHTGQWLADGDRLALVDLRPLARATSPCFTGEMAYGTARPPGSAPASLPDRSRAAPASTPSCSPRTSPAATSRPPGGWRPPLRRLRPRRRAAAMRDAAP